MQLYICNYVTNSIYERYTNNIIQFDNVNFGEDFYVLHFNAHKEKEDKEL